ncbi:NUDIX domain-containing protein [Actinotalea sp. M2MS4P-6]|uniref:NUDIX hydrolase n=1 Tax=Actinotalea sp. M2MS4P-6 TaxID=2983762 RepID=UPI0021E4D126|nr:NUDIX domain-containing protein [Actinotalea sp. M2MS4P-6]MCV2393175.1 NUDIX domain-containing protein [Actinotalea sp. M2MS4P-6]
MPIPDFVLRLREKVGTDLLWLPGVSGVVLDDDGRVLLGRRSDNGRWAVPSGILEPGEEPAIALVREVLEETGVHAEVVALTSVSSGDPIRYPNGDRAQYLDVGFLCRAVGGEAHVADDESTEVGWFDPDALPETITEASVQWLQRARAWQHGQQAGIDPQPWFAR